MTTTATDAPPAATQTSDEKLARLLIGRAGTAVTSLLGRASSTMSQWTMSRFSALVASACRRRPTLAPGQWRFR